jgi:hypothetical protein
MNNNKKMTLILSSCPNPDYGQTEAPAPEEKVPVKSFAEASARARRYIGRYELGGGNWAGGDILDEHNEVVGRVSYNGRVWRDDDCLYDPGREKEYETCLDAGKMDALRQDYKTYCQLLRLWTELTGEVTGQYRVSLVEDLSRLADDLLYEISVGLGNEGMYPEIDRYLNDLNRRNRALPDFETLSQWVARQAGQRQPAITDLEGWYAGQIGHHERCLHLTFDDEETLVLDIFDRVSATLPFGRGDLIVDPLYLNLRTGAAWYEGGRLIPPPGHADVADLNQITAGFRHLSSELVAVMGRINMGQVIDLVRQRLDDEAATDPDAIAAWYADVSGQLSWQLEIPLTEAKWDTHLALGRLAGVPDEHLADEFPVSAPLVILARRHGHLNFPDGRDFDVELPRSE